MLTCRGLIAFLDDYLAGGLSAWQSGQFRLHLTMCRSCRDYVRSYEETVRLGKAAFDDLAAEVPPEVPEELVRHIVMLCGA